LFTEHMHHGRVSWPTDGLQPGAVRYNFSSWNFWKPVPPSFLHSLPPRGQAWETSDTTRTELDGSPSTTTHCQWWSHYNGCTWVKDVV